jgi:predicted Zn finger-like uncharacterized protein
LPAAAIGYIDAAMILSCSSCQARYLVPASHFAMGPRMVRCARCSHMWMAGLPPEPAAALAEQLSALLPPPAEPMPPLPPAANLPVVRKGVPFWQRDWALAGAVVVLAAFMLIFAIDRKDIAERWPATEKLYDGVGLHVYHVGEGLSLRQVRSEMQFEGETQLAVEGQVHNDTDKPQSIPPVLAAAIGPDGKIMQSWQIDAPAATVAPGGSVAFTSSIHAPQGTVTEINLHFVEPKNGP